MRPGGQLACQLALLSLAAAGSRAAMDVAEAMSKLPSCGIECFTSAIASSSCGLDLPCICADKDLYKSTQSCVLEECSVLDGLEVARFEAEACERPYRSRRTGLLLVLIIYIPAWFCPWLRLYSRWTTTNGFAVDDWLMLACGIIYTPFVIMGQYAGLQSFGVDTWNVPIESITRGLELFYVDESFYLVLLCLTKVSVLFFYLRIFPNQRFHYAAHATMAFVILPTVIFTFMQIFQCLPVRYVWEGWYDDSRSEHCLNINLLTYTAAAFSIAQDLVILLLPLPLLLRLHTGTRAKAGIIFMFSLGVFILITSCVRLRYVIRFGHTANPAWDFYDTMIWSGLEVAVSIIVACLPALRVLLVGVLPGIFASLVSRGGHTSRGGYVKETGFSSGSGRNGGGGGGGSSAAARESRRRKSMVFFSSKDREEDGNESQIELGLQLGDKVRGDVQTEISVPPRDVEEQENEGIRINTTTTTWVAVND